MADAVDAYRSYNSQQENELRIIQDATVCASEDICHVLQRLIKVNILSCYLICVLHSVFVGFVI